MCVVSKIAKFVAHLIHTKDKLAIFVWRQLDEASSSLTPAINSPNFVNQGIAHKSRGKKPGVCCYLPSWVAVWAESGITIASLRGHAKNAGRIHFDFVVFLYGDAGPLARPLTPFHLH